MIKLKEFLTKNFDGQFPLDFFSKIIKSVRLNLDIALELIEKNQVTSYLELIAQNLKDDKLYGFDIKQETDDDLYTFFDKLVTLYRNDASLDEDGKAMVIKERLYISGKYFDTCMFLTLVHNCRKNLPVNYLDHVQDIPRLYRYCLRRACRCFYDNNTDFAYRVFMKDTTSGVNKFYENALFGIYLNSNSTDDLRTVYEKEYRKTRPKYEIMSLTFVQHTDGSFLPYDWNNFNVYDTILKSLLNQNFGTPLKKLTEYESFYPLSQLFLCNNNNDIKYFDNLVNNYLEPLFS